MIENYEIADQATMTTALPATFSSVVKATLDELSGLTGEADEVHWFLRTLFSPNFSV